MATRKKTYRFTNKERELKKSIIQLMNDKDIYENTDEFVIDELIYNLHISSEAKSNIQTYGIMVNVIRDPEAPPLYQTNQAVSIYNQAIKAVVTLCTKLSINSQERSKLNLVKKDNDQLDFLDE